MKKLLLICMLAVLGWHQADAQTSKNPGEVFIQQATFEHNDAVKRFTSDFTTMFNLNFDAFNESGNETNTAIVNHYGDGNSSAITQNGWGNKALVNLLGDFNTTGLIQSGSDNQFILNLEGNNNSISGEQRGSENTFRLDLMGSLNNQSFSQRGSNLTFELIDNGNGGVPLQIEQRGQGATVRVENH